MPICRFKLDSLLGPLNEGETLLTPNHRSAKVILQAYGDSKKTGEVWLRPKVYAIDVWLAQLWIRLSSDSIEPFCNLQILDSFAEQCIWTKSLMASTEKYPLLNVQQTAVTISRSYHLFNQWLFPEETARWSSMQSKDFSAFLYWSKQYQSYCQKHGLSGLSDAIAILIPRLGELAKFLPPSLLLVNFTNPPPLYGRLIENLSNVLELRHHLRSTSKLCSLEENYKWKPELGKVKRLKYQDLNAEISACVKHYLKHAKESSNDHLGIIIDHKSDHSFLVWKEFNKQSNQRISNLSPINAQYFNTFSTPQKLTDAKLIKLALSLLELNLTQIETEKFCYLLQSSRSVLSDEELPARINLELFLRSKFSATTRLSQLQSVMQREEKSYYCPQLTALLVKFSEYTRRTSDFLTLSAWVEIFKKQLELLGWPGSELSKTESEELSQWQTAFDQLSGSSFIVGKVNILGALRHLRSSLYQTLRRNPFNSKLNISLVSPEEALDFDFDSLWWLSADHKRLPDNISPDPFLPLSIQQIQGIPDSDYELLLKQANLTLTRLQQNTYELIFSHHKYEDDLEVRPSPLLSDIPLTPSLESESLKDRTARVNSAQIDYIQEPLCLPLDSVIKAGGTSLITDQSNCPFKAFATHRLGARKLRSLQSGLNPMDRGTALHLALEKLSVKLDSKNKIIESSVAERDTYIAESIEPAIEQLRKQHPDILTPAFANLERIRLSNLLNSFLDFELSRSSFFVYKTEHQITWKHSLLSLNFRVDRIDTFDDGSLALIDYKSGAKSSYYWYDDRPDNLQLPLYQLAIDSNLGDISGAFIYQVNVEKVTLTGTTDKDDIHQNIKPLAQVRLFDGSWTNLQERWNRIVLAMAAEFEKGLLAVAPTRSDQTCLYCDLSSLCRVNEQETILPSEDELPL